jgi:ABC-type transporter Mla subunit MlaD
MSPIGPFKLPGNGNGDGSIYNSDRDACPARIRIDELHSRVDALADEVRDVAADLRMTSKSMKDEIRGVSTVLNATSKRMQDQVAVFGEQIQKFAAASAMAVDMRNKFEQLVTVAYDRFVASKIRRKKSS